MTAEERNEFVAGVIFWCVKYAFKLQPKLCRTVGFDEVESDLWEHLLLHAHKYDPQKGKPTTWASWQVRGYLSQKIAKLGRKKNIWPRTTPISDNYIDDQFELADTIDSWRLMNSLREAIAKLPEPQRVAIVGRLDGLTLREIAKTEKVTKEAIRQRILMAVRSLRSMFGVTPLLNSAG